MAAMLAQPAAPSPVPIAANPAASAVPRKRRRRAPATGAAEDCFSCQGKGVKCDRRRPYCGPCLEGTDSCGGYRTTLTWGVGVASRGKLRGMTLPISLETAPSIPGLERKSQPKKKSPSVEKAVPVSRKTKPVKDVDSMEEDIIVSSAPENKRLSIASSYDFISVGSPSTNSSSTSLSAQNVFPIQQRSTQARPSISTTLLANTSSSYPSFQPISPPRQEFPTTLQFQHKSAFPMSTHSTPQSSPVPLSPMSEYEPSFGGMHSPFALSPVNSSGSLFDMGMDSAATSAYHPMSMTATSGPGPFAGLHSELHSSMHHGGVSNINQHHFHRHSSISHSFGGGSEMGGSHSQMHAGSGNLSALLYGDDMLGLGENDYQFSPTYPSHMPTSCPSGLTETSQSYQSSLHDGTPLATSPMHIPCLLPPQLANKSPELRYLVDYYDRTVCPALVTFDGPGNPYRSHILRMAFHNDALMEAVYALASSHLHQRRNGIKTEPSFPGASFGTPESTSVISPINSLDDIHGSQQAHWGRSQSVPDIDFFDGGASDHQGISASLEHKNSSIRMLNSQLANPTLATTDSAMATLLLLCLYHVCETGQGQFRTHLAGVKKLMSMRGAGNVNQRWTWMETVFTWLENMSAPMNNRFSQLDTSDYMDSICEPSGDWDIESLTGCDRELFAKISKLSMVNMLSQQPANNAHRRWMVPSEQEEDEWEQPKRNEDDGRVEFWEAWNTLRKDLNDWNPSPRFAATSSRQRMSDSVTSISSIQTVDSGFASMNSTSPNSPVLSGFRTGASFSPRKMSFKAQEAVETNHWLHASNVHRCAALLYLDRLAYPHLSSSHPIFQNTVRKVLDHMTCIPIASGLNKTLFWPLFVTASECVVDAHRELIRQRCYSMQAASGFFNKVAGLDVLERIWSEDEDLMMGGLETDESIGGRGLKWRKVTSLDDGTEYLFI